MLITKQLDLEILCEEIKQEKFITVDTEFIRDSSYWSKLCLLQVATSKRAVAIDPLSKDINLDCFYKILFDKNIIKVLHGSRQDIEIFYHATGKMPQNIFDTQIAAMVCGFGDQISYEKLVKYITNANIDKSSRYTDWSKRPLSNKQISYALSDVTHLRDVYISLNQEIEEKGRKSWIDDEHKLLLHHETYDTDPKNAWKRIKIRTTKPKTIANIKAIAKWREELAQNKNKPRPRIMRDDIIQNLALNPPKTIEDFKKIRRFPKDVAKKDLETLLKYIKTAKCDGNIPETLTTSSISDNTAAIVELLKVLLKYSCKKYKIAPKLVASAKDIEAIAQNDKASVKALKSWRYEIFGKYALDIKHGKIAIRVKNGEIDIFSLHS